MNKLTERLLEAGYTKDSHPDYVEWSSWNDFEYTREFLISTVWEAPCGLLKQGINSYNHGSSMGVDYCPENDNPRYGCPYFDEKPCQYRHTTVNLWGWNCTLHQTDKSYNYEQSIEKLWDEWDRIKNAAFLELTIKSGFCENMVWDRRKRKYVPRFIVENCINRDCKNGVCAITKQPRNLERVNIFYDVLRERHYRKGLIEHTERSVTKGVKTFEKSIARTDAEIWIKENENKEKFKPGLTPIDRKELYFSEHHGDTGYGEYDFCKFSVTPLNIRIEKRESRDMLKDLQDTQEGIEVRHDSDLRKVAAKVKSDRRRKAREERARPENVLKKLLRITEQETIDKTKEMLSEALEDYEEIAERVGLSTRLIKKIAELPEMKKIEQPSLFE
ncbi:hypothetical protein CEB3_c17770 [Peptococcaceae bacterium CEB3]|nr:hypothetical protein CEB3_c17770 [Peptococcaceae bacterium CEB3]